MTINEFKYGQPWKVWPSPLKIFNNGEKTNIPHYNRRAAILEYILKKVRFLLNSELNQQLLLFASFRMLFASSLS